MELGLRVNGKFSGTNDLDCSCASRRRKAFRCNNTALGAGALFSTTTGSQNTAVGRTALFHNVSGFQNAAVGMNALLRNTTGFHNSAIGIASLFSNTTGNHNTANGDDALEGNTTGNFNTADGAHSLTLNTTGSGNTVLGFNSGNSITSADNVICIGENVAGANVSNRCFIGNIFGATSSGGIVVFINSSGQLGTATSSRRFKDDIKPMDQASEVLFSLKPVSFHYKKEIDASGISQFGLVAEEVEKVNRDLVVRDQEGKPYSVRYDQVNVMLLNEFLKEHRTVEELKEEIAALTATVKEQASQIQKVNARVEAARLAAQVAENNQ
jgi:hypothetical protein